MSKRLRLSAFLLAVLLGAPAAVWAKPGDVVRRFPAPANRPTGLTFDGKSLWMADRGTSQLYQIDPATGKTIRTMTSPCYWPAGLAWHKGRLWVLDEDQRKAHCLNIETGITEQSLPLSCKSPEAIASDGENLWVVQNRRDRPGEIFQISTDDGTTVAQMLAPSTDTQGLMFDGKYLWASDRLDDKIFKFVPGASTVVMAFESPSKYPRGLAFDGKHLWNVDYESDEIYQIVAKDDVPSALLEAKRENLEYIHEVRNQGSGEITKLDVYLAIPEESPTQKFLGKPTFKPQPTAFLTDQWGQKVAHFQFTNIPPGKVVEATMSIDVELRQVRFFLEPEKTGTLDDIPAEIKKQYLGDAGKFRVTDPRIKKIAREAVGKEKNCYWIARRIFDHMIKKVRYNLDGSWNIAPIVLERGSGSCSEYSFSTIALCRAAGLPARYVGSVVVRGDDASTDPGLFHRWPEVYLPHYGWVPMDPSSSRAIFRTPAAAADAVGNRRAGYLITTQSGGPSNLLQWDYNSHADWQTKGPTTVFQQKWGEWSPLPDPEGLDAEGKAKDPKANQQKSAVPVF